MGRRAKVTREDVLGAAREAFSERGFDGTTLADIAARVGISPAALLRHAPTKQALFAAALTEERVGEAFPMGFLAQVDAREDPCRVLRRFAETLIPFIEAKMGETIVRFMHAKVARTLRLPFDPRSKDSPPRRTLALLEDYLRRAAKAGRVRLRDPRAGALAFMGSMQAYVFLHHVLRVVEPPLPLPRYLDTILDIWTRGAIRERKARR